MAVGLRRALVALCSVLVAVCGTSAGPARAEEVSRVCSFSDDRLDEISGMALSLRHQDVLWLHNDSSGGPYIYAVSARNCRTIARVTIRDIEARDIEAIAAGRGPGGRPVLWIADIGDNRDSWPEVRLHRIREPRRLVDASVDAETFRFTFEDGPHNAEAILADPSSQQLWVVTKQLARGRIYALPKRLSASTVNVATPTGRVGGMVTDGAVSPDGRRYVLRDYVSAEIFDGLPRGNQVETIWLPFQPQGEAVAWSSDGSALLIASERDKRLLRVEVPAMAASAPAPSPGEATTQAEPSRTDPAATQASPETAAPVVWLLLAAAVVGVLVTTVVRSRSRSRR